MKLITLTNGANKVQYKVDLIGDNDGNTTIMEVSGVDTDFEKQRLNLKQIPSTLADLKKLASDNGLALTIQDQDSSTVLVAAPTTTTTTTP